ncbi:mechanosensitive ion channel family protein [Demequina aestuarii]|uniref:mechanosensitive ion channel family protein n=1 Tax=Demequina aestuarii TaxID=327095 RepID=UPI000A57D45F|nr:mechanosensitive ion channel domain-containing protein [Demequina aestuarii]
MNEWLNFAVSTAISVGIAVVAGLIIKVIMQLTARRQAWAKALVTHSRRPFWALVLICGVWAGVYASFPVDAWFGGLNRAFTILVIGASAWMLAALVEFVTDLALANNRIDVPDNRLARKLRSQTLIVRRLAIAIIVIIGIGAVMLTFDSVRALGASVLASAGLVSIVAGLAAQSLLANMFAGIQLVFSDALRVDDVIVAEGEWGRVGEITLSYVVLELWDDRRLVLPCTYFTTTPYENWTRRGSELLGSVEFDLDWRVSPQRMREQLEVVLEQTSLWDGRAQVLQVTEAVGGYVRVRILVTAADAPTLFDLRCYVREAMVMWLQTEMPDAAPAQRVLVGESTPPQKPRRPRKSDPTETAEIAGLFTGSVEAEERATQFTHGMAREVREREAEEHAADAGSGDETERS